MPNCLRVNSTAQINWVIQIVRNHKQILCIDIHKHFFIATILSISGEKEQQRFSRDDDGILALKNWVLSEKCDVIACESTSDFWVPIYDSLIKHLPVIIGLHIKKQIR